MVPSGRRHILTRPTFTKSLGVVERTEISYKKKTMHQLSTGIILKYKHRLVELERNSQSRSERFTVSTLPFALDPYAQLIE